MNNIAKNVAENLGAIVANQSLKIANLQDENKSLLSRNDQLQQTIDQLRKKVRNSEFNANSSTNKQINKRNQ